MKRSVVILDLADGDRRVHALIESLDREVDLVVLGSPGIVTPAMEPTPLPVAPPPGHGRARLPPMEVVGLHTLEAPRVVPPVFLDGRSHPSDGAYRARPAHRRRRDRRRGGR